MKILAAFAAAILLAAAAPKAEDFRWLAGTWVLEKQGGRWTEERWAPPRGGVMLGTALSGRGGVASGYEFMRIAPDESGALAFWGAPDGAAPVAFRLVGGEGQEAVFENPAHDYPTRIVYRRDGDVLTATISGPGGSDPKSWSYVRKAD